MPERTTKQQVESALRVFKNTALRLGLDFSSFELEKHSKWYGLRNNGQHLLIRGLRPLSQWYDILDAANETLLAIERIQKQG